MSSNDVTFCNQLLIRAGGREKRGWGATRPIKQDLAVSSEANVWALGGMQGGGGWWGATRPMKQDLALILEVNIWAWGGSWSGGGAGNKTHQKRS